MKVNFICRYGEAKKISDKYRDHLIGRDFLTGDQMRIGYERRIDQPFIVEVVPAPADENISIICMKRFIELGGKSWDEILQDGEWNKDEYIAIVIATNGNRNIFANELNQFLLDHSDLLLT